MAYSIGKSANLASTTESRVIDQQPKEARLIGHSIKIQDDHRNPLNRGRGRRRGRRRPQTQERTLGSFMPTTEGSVHKKPIVRVPPIAKVVPVQQWLIQQKTNLELPTDALEQMHLSEASKPVSAEINPTLEKIAPAESKQDATEPTGTPEDWWKPCDPKSYPANTSKSEMHYQMKTQALFKLDYLLNCLRAPDRQSCQKAARLLTPLYRHCNEWGLGIPGWNAISDRLYEARTIIFQEVFQPLFKQSSDIKSGNSTTRNLNPIQSFDIAFKELKKQVLEVYDLTIYLDEGDYDSWIMLACNTIKWDLLRIIHKEYPPKQSIDLLVEFSKKVDVFSIPKFHDLMRSAVSSVFHIALNNHPFLELKKEALCHLLIFICESHQLNCITYKDQKILNRVRVIDKKLKDSIPKLQSALVKEGLSSERLLAESLQLPEIEYRLFSETQLESQLAQCPPMWSSPQHRGLPSQWEGLYQQVSSTDCFSGQFSNIPEFPSTPSQPQVHSWQLPLVNPAPTASSQLTSQWIFNISNGLPLSLPITASFEFLLNSFLELDYYCRLNNIHPSAIQALLLDVTAKLSSEVVGNSSALGYWDLRHNLFLVLSQSETPLSQLTTLLEGMRDSSSRSSGQAGIKEIEYYQSILVSSIVQHRKNLTLPIN